MPSPLAHAIGGFAAGWLLAPRPLPPPPLAPGSHVARMFAWPLLFTATGLVADLDLLAGRHHAATHSIGAITVVLGVALAVLGPRRWRLALAFAASYGSHVLFDWLGEDSSVPIGIMALWPFSDAYYLSHVNLFMGISRRYWELASWRQNLVSVSVELAVMLPVLWLTCRVRPCPWRASRPVHQDRDGGNGVRRQG